MSETTKKDARVSDGRWMPGAIPGSRQGLWRPTRAATSAQIAESILWDERQARDFEAKADAAMASLHWKRWLGLHFAFVRALGREARA